MNNNKEIKSHVQMPNFLLKEFEDIGHNLYYFDISNANFHFREYFIKKGHSKSLNVEKGYYSQFGENLLSKGSEEPFSKIVRTLKATDFDQSPLYFGSDFRLDVLTFIGALFFRDKKMLEVIGANSLFFNAFPKQFQHDLTVSLLDIEDIKRMFYDWTVTFLINRSRVPYVLPISGIYGGSKILRCSAGILPITPYLAITLIKGKNVNFPIIDNQIAILTIDSNSAVQESNCRAFSWQYSLGHGYIVSPNKQELLKMTKYWYENRENFNFTP